MPTTSRRQQARARNPQPVDNVRDERRGQPAVGPYWPLEVRVQILGGDGSAPLAVCGLCCAIVPASPGAQQRHSVFHQRIEGGS